MSPLNFGLYHAQSRSAALRRKADMEEARAAALRHKADLVAQAAEALREQATQSMFGYLTQPRLPEFEKAKRAYESGTPLDEVTNDLDAFIKEHLTPLDALFFDRRDDAARAPVIARISEINAWIIEQKRMSEATKSGEPLKFTPEEIKKLNGETSA